MKRVKLHYSAFQAYRRNEGARAALSEAQKIAARANSMAAPTHAGQPSYTAEGPRANEKGATVLVHTDNLAARIDNAVRDTLAKALGGGQIERHEPYPVRHRGTHGRFGRPVRVETIDRCAGVGRFTLGGFGRGTASRAATVETHR